MERARPPTFVTSPRGPLLFGSPGTSTPCGPRRRAATSGRCRRSAGTGGLCAGRRACRRVRRRAVARIRRAAASSARAQLVVGRVGERQPRRDARLEQRLAHPHVPDARRPRAGPEAPRRGAVPGGSARRLTSIASRSGGSARMSGPRRRRARSLSSSTGPCQSTASFVALRRTSHGLPVTSRPRSCTRQRPFILRWLRSVTPPSNWRKRFLPTASTTRGASRPAARRCA